MITAHFNVKRKVGPSSLDEVQNTISKWSEVTAERRKRIDRKISTDF